MFYPGNNILSAARHALIIGLGAFFLAIAISFSSQGLLNKINSIILAFTLLIVIILIGIFFDIIGTASTKASEKPFHAKASRKINGAKEAIRLVRNADKVASFCNDVVGDISGTLSGAIGAAIILRLSFDQINIPDVLVGTIMIASIAGVTIGGKALGKSFALKEANKIIFQVGKVMAWFENVLHIQIFNGMPKRGKKK